MIVISPIGTMSSQWFGVLFSVSLLAILTVPSQAVGQPSQTEEPAVVSAEILANGEVTFRIAAPEATVVTFASSDIFDLGPKAQMIKNDSGVWETTVGPLEPGAYRYNFVVNGVSTTDPQRSSISESNTHVQSLLVVPGSEYMDTRDVPRGAVAEITYYSTSLGRFRRMHVYTPPGYEANQETYPIFYLLHGAVDNDDAWTSVGRAGIILDNMLAAGEVQPMVVVMPAGHTRPDRSFGGGQDEFFEDFVNDVMPYAETHYRVLTDRAHRAIAGLSMGGAQTLNAAFAHLDRFAYIGVFSSGIFGRSGGVDAWEQGHLATLDNAALKPGLELIWFKTGVEDSLISSSRATVDMLRKHGFDVTFEEGEGGHTWINWRAYLIEFAPQLFQ
jgi:enterochelin esterase-like enzyme